jgi:hypothetical protein
MNQIFIPVYRVHLETVFESGQRTQYALLEPEGGISPLRVKFHDLRDKLSGWFSDELSAEAVVERIDRMLPDRQLVVIVSMGAPEGEAMEWTARIRNRYPFEDNHRPRGQSRGEQRKSPRRAPTRPTDVKLELGQSSIEGTVYNISEHGLGIALLTSDLERLEGLRLDQEVEVQVPSPDPRETGRQRVPGRIRSQDPADGGCVLGIELREKLYLDGSTPIEA